MSKRDKRFDAKQRELFRQDKPVDHATLQKWHKKAVERREMPEALLQLGEDIVSLGEDIDSTARLLAEWKDDIAVVAKKLEFVEAELSMTPGTGKAHYIQYMKSTASSRAWRQHHQGPSKACTVPRWGEITLLFVLPKKARETMPGDLAEEFRDRIVPKMHPLLARAWYWWQVGCAVPWVWLAVAFELLKRKIGL